MYSTHSVHSPHPAHTGHPAHHATNHSSHSGHTHPAHNDDDREVRYCSDREVGTLDFLSSVFDFTRILLCVCCNQCYPIVWNKYFFSYLRFSWGKWYGNVTVHISTIQLQVHQLTPIPTFISRFIRRCIILFSNHSYRFPGYMHYLSSPWTHPT